MLTAVAPQVANSAGNYPAAIGLGGKGYGPGARVQAAMAFNELTNDLYIFGGFGSDYNSEWGFLNDLWRYNLNKETWTWMGGSASVAKGAANPHNGICGRSGALMVSGNDGLQFVLTAFGGVGNPAGSEPGALSDIWEFNTQLPKDFTITVPASTRTTTNAETAAPTKQPTTEATSAAAPTSDSKPTTDKPTSAASAAATSAAAAAATTGAKPTSASPSPTPAPSDGSFSSSRHPCFSWLLSQLLPPPPRSPSPLSRQPRHRRTPRCSTRPRPRRSPRWSWDPSLQLS